MSTPKSDPSKAVYTLRAPAEFYDLLGRCLIVRPDGEIVQAFPQMDVANRRATIVFKARARTDGWKVRAARWLLGMA